MKEFNNIEEMKEYYNEETNTFYIEEDISINFNFNERWNIDAWNIDARNITARNIDAWDINAGDIHARNIDAGDINAGDIHAGDISACDIDARDIHAWDIEFWAVCVSYNNIICDKIEGRRERNKMVALDGVIKEMRKEED